MTFLLRSFVGNVPNNEGPLISGLTSGTFGNCSKNINFVLSCNTGDIKPLKSGDFVEKYYSVTTILARIKALLEVVGGSSVRR